MAGPESENDRISKAEVRDIAQSYSELFTPTESFEIDEQVSPEVVEYAKNLATARRLAKVVEQADANELVPRPEKSRGVQITPKPDDRIERILADPEKYFAEARIRIRAEVEAEIAEENRRRGISGQDKSF